MTGIAVAAGACFALGAAAGWLIAGWWHRMIVDQFVDETVEEAAREIARDDDWGWDGSWIRRAS